MHFLHYFFVYILHQLSFEQKKGADHTDHKNSNSIIHTLPICVSCWSAHGLCASVRERVIFWNKTVLSEHAQWCNHTTNLPICLQQHWLIEYVTGGWIGIKRQQKIQSWGESVEEQRFFFYFIFGKHFCIFVSTILDVEMGGGITAISSKASLPREALINEPYLNIYVLRGQDKE